MKWDNPSVYRTGVFILGQPVVMKNGHKKKRPNASVALVKEEQNTCPRNLYRFLSPCESALSNTIIISCFFPKIIKFSSSACAYLGSSLVFQGIIIHLQIFLDSRLKLRIIYRRRPVSSKSPSHGEGSMHFIGTLLLIVLFPVLIYSLLFLWDYWYEYRTRSKKKEADLVQRVFKLTR